MTCDLYFDVHKNITCRFERSLKWHIIFILTFTKIAYRIDLNRHKKDIQSLFGPSQNSTQHRLELSQKMTYNLYWDCHQTYLVIFPWTIMKIALRLSFAQRKAMKIIKVLASISQVEWQSINQSMRSITCTPKWVYLTSKLLTY